MFPDVLMNFELVKLSCGRSVWRGLDPRAEGCWFEPRGKQKLAGVLGVRGDAKELSQYLLIPLSKVPAPPKEQLREHRYLLCDPERHIAAEK